MNDASAYSLIGIRPTKGYVLVDIFDRGDQIRSLGNGKKLILLGDDDFNTFKKDRTETKHRGIRPRWAHVIAISKEAATVGLMLGDTVLCDELKWSRKIPYQRCGHGEFMYFWRIAVDDILMYNEDMHASENAVAFTKKLNEAKAGWGEGLDG